MGKKRMLTLISSSLLIHGSDSGGGGGEDEEEEEMRRRRRGCPLSVHDYRLKAPENLSPAVVLCLQKILIVLPAALSI